MKKRAILSLVLFSFPACFALSLPLRVKNMTTYAYNQAPVQFGVPFPQGKLSVADVSKLTISDQATHFALPAGIAKTVVWHDGSVRWVRVIFPATVAAGGTVNIVLSDANKNELGGLTAVAGTNTVTVNTGVLKFTVKGNSFNLVDEAWANEVSPGVFDDAHKIIDPGNAGGFVIKIGTTEYKSNTGNATVTLVESSKYHAIIKATGKVGSYVYTIYYYAYDQKPYIKLVHNFYYDNSDGTASSQIGIADLCLKVMTRVAGGNAVFSGTVGDVSTTVSGTEEAFLHYLSEDAYSIKKDATLLSSGKGMNEGTQGAQNTGWGHMTSGTIGVGACVRWMWQMAPKNISLHGTGEAAIHLYSNKNPALNFYGGAGRTHFAGLAFTTSTAMAKEMFYAVCQPLCAVAPTKWTTCQTQVMGNLVPCEAAVLKDNLPVVLNNYRMMGFLFGHSKRKTMVDAEDSYGFLELGDLSEPPMDCGGRYWANNYYDFPHCIAQAFLITGSEYNLETGVMHALHLGDMDHNNITGQSRTCPGSGNFGDYTICAIGYSGTTNHYKCQGLFDWACILAEPMLGDLGLRVAPWAKGFPGGELRATGHVLEALAGAYGYTNDAQWKTSLESAYSAMSVAAAAVGSNTFMQAIIGEGLMWTILEDPSFQTARDALSAWADHWVANYSMSTHSYCADYPTLSGWFLGPMGYAAKIFPSKLATYSPSMTDNWQDWSTNNAVQGEGKVKTFTQLFRGIPPYLYLVTKTDFLPADPDYMTLVENVTVGTETKRATPMDNMSLLAHPNPFYPSVTITTPANVRGVLRIFDPSGRLVYTADGRNNGLTWDASNRRPGLYLVSFQYGNRSVSRKIMCLK